MFPVNTQYSIKDPTHEAIFFVGKSARQYYVLKIIFFAARVYFDMIFWGKK